MSKANDPPYLTESFQNKAAGDAYLVKLVEKPSADVTLSAASVDGNIVVLTDQLVFTPENWNKEQTIMMFGKEDDVMRPALYTGSVSFRAISDDVGFNLGPATIPFAIQDNDKGETEWLQSGCFNKFDT